MTVRIALAIALLVPTLAQAKDCPGNRRQATGGAVARSVDAARSRAEQGARRRAERSCAQRGGAVTTIDLKSSVKPQGSWYRARVDLTYGCFGG